MSRESMAAWLTALPDCTVITADLAPYPDEVRLFNDDGDWRVIGHHDVWTSHAIAAERYGPITIDAVSPKALISTDSTLAAAQEALRKYHPSWPYDPKFAEQATVIIQAAIIHTTRKELL